MEEKIVETTAEVVTDVAVKESGKILGFNKVGVFVALGVAGLLIVPKVFKKIKSRKTKVKQPEDVIVEQEATTQEEAK